VWTMLRLRRDKDVVPSILTLLEGMYEDNAFVG